MLLGLRKKRILLYYVRDTTEYTKIFYMSSFRVFFIKTSSLKFDRAFRVLGPNLRNTISRVFKLLFWGQAHCQVTWSVEKPLLLSANILPITGTILKTCKYTLTLSGTVEQTLWLKAVSSSTEYLTLKIKVLWEQIQASHLTSTRCWKEFFFSATSNLQISAPRGLQKSSRAFSVLESKDADSHKQYI